MFIETSHIDKRWGYEKIIVNKPEYCGKILHIRKGLNTSWHFHKLKDEVFHVVSGKILLLYSYLDESHFAEQIELSVGDSFHIPRGLRHRLIALEESDVVEFSTQHFDEDSHRLEI